MVSSLFSAIAGIIAEPVIGVGTAQDAVGLERGIMGLICKPAKGSIDLVSYTNRGLQSTPKISIIGFNRLVKRMPRAENPNDPDSLKATLRDFNPEDHIVVGEEQGQTLYISKRSLRDQIRNSQVLSSLISEAPRLLPEEEQKQMEHIILRQREIIARREKKLKTEKSTMVQIKTITEDLLRKLDDTYNQQKRVVIEEDSVSERDSETSSMADEKEIHHKLRQILTIIKA